MKRPVKIALIVVAAVVVLGGGVYAVFVLQGSDAPPPVSLSTPTPTATPTGADEDEESAAGGTADGAWAVEESDRTFVGYRVTEQLAGLSSPNDAVGRTPAVEGTMVIEGTTVTTVEITADLSQLESDESRRDNRLRSEGLETERFPEATFRLAEPIDLGAAPAEGAEITADAVGELTIHGVTQQVTIPLQARWSGDEIEVIGSLPIEMAAYEIDPPTGGAVLSIEDNGTLELQLLFVR